MLLRLCNNREYRDRDRFEPHQKYIVHDRLRQHTYVESSGIPQIALFFLKISVTVYENFSVIYIVKSHTNRPLKHSP